ncbi:MAG: hypothetical protein HC918_13135, partial [Oscillatoriales cyanobacterium SM2_1_8]|nr:hypothetical protein [Oscillatoriales cyanobacterium SM2_1_8]
MPSESIAQFLEAFARFGIQLGLTASERLLARLGHPERRVPVIHVAGTNGKGSTCAMTAAILQAAGYRVGLYTSPHLVRWEERVQVNGQPVASEVLWAALQRVQGAIDCTPGPTQFEVLTAAMWGIFAEANLDVAVVEVGLGGVSMLPMWWKRPWPVPSRPSAADRLARGWGRTLSANRHRKDRHSQAGLPGLRGDRNAPCGPSRCCGPSGGGWGAPDV